MRKRTRIGLAALIAAALAAVWLMLSPGWALAAMRNAAKAKDAQRVAGYVDATAVKRSITEQIAAQMAFAQTSKGAIDPAVAELAMRDARRMGETLEPARIVMGMLAAPVDPVIDRTGLRTFIAGPKESDGGLEFELQGVTWRVVGIRPPNKP